jgi:hypothetical protein
VTDWTTLDGQMHAFVERLYPLCRSITGDGVRATLDVLAESIPLNVREIPRGTAVLAWTVPKEWNIRDAYVADPEGRRVIDFTRTNLHWSAIASPVRTRMSLAALREHLHTLPEQPDFVRTAPALRPLIVGNQPSLAPHLETTQIRTGLVVSVARRTARRNRRPAVDGDSTGTGGSAVGPGNCDCWGQ